MRMKCDKCGDQFDLLSEQEAGKLHYTGCGGRLQLDNRPSHSAASGAAPVRQLAEVERLSRELEHLKTRFYPNGNTLLSYAEIRQRLLDAEIERTNLRIEVDRLKERQGEK